MASKQLTCLLTGFDAFGEHKVNPTEVIVRAFPDSIDNADQIQIRKVILPTAGRNGWSTLKTELQSTLREAPGKVLILMTGLAAKSTAMSLERFAMNFKDYRIADNSGDQPIDEPVIPDADDLLRTNADLAALQKQMSARGHSVEISNHAGTFVCNDLYYRALHFAAEEKRIATTLFVHLPDRQSELMASALEHLLRIVASKVN